MEQRNALISVYYKDGLLPLLQALHSFSYRFISTGGTARFIEEAGFEVQKVESLTGYPSILDGRVKTLHPGVFGGILARRHMPEDRQTLDTYGIPPIDLVIVNLYPFEDTMAQGGSHEELIEKIDIGGISLIRAAAKNHRDVTCISHKNQYDFLLEILEKHRGNIPEEIRKKLAADAFAVSSHYDIKIMQYLSGLLPEQPPVFRETFTERKTLRYGENPHQQGYFFGNLDTTFEPLHGKDLSYNNLLDIDAAVHLIEDFKTEQPVFAILKHNNACGVAIRSSLKQAYLDALAGDPLSAFGGVLVSNTSVDEETAREIHKLFFEIIIAPEYDPAALEILRAKKKRIILKKKKGLRDSPGPRHTYRSILNGVLYQEADTHTDTREDMRVVTRIRPGDRETEDLLFASVIAKNSKSNTIVLVKNKQLLGSGVGQTSRIDALRQAIEKAERFGMDLQGAVMASDAFFPFPDNVETAHHAGIRSIIQPGGSIKDQLSIDYCDRHGLSMVFTGYRHFRH